MVWVKPQKTRNIKSILSALSIANAGDTIWMAKGTYYHTTGTDRNLSLVINNGVAIYGGF